uniref:Uncharacterized protein n=1 Tax=Anopheles epiroticus TaxID=199890 RepID=A0A182PSD6_9DIPT
MSWKNTIAKASGMRPQNCISRFYFIAQTDLIPGWVGSALVSVRFYCDTTMLLTRARVLYDFACALLHIAYGLVLFVVHHRWIRFWPPSVRPVVSVRQGKSGVTVTESFFQVKQEEKARQLARYFGYTGDSDQGVLETLEKVPAKQLARHQNEAINEAEKQLALIFIFRP